MTTATTDIQTVFVLFAVFQIKHFFADFPLQREYMLQKVRPGWDFLFPLSLHCGVHALFTLVICLIYRPELWWLAAVDFAVHFIMDRIKSGPRYLGRFNNVHAHSYWITFGFDQMIHHLTSLAIIWTLVVF